MGFLSLAPEASRAWAQQSREEYIKAELLRAQELSYSNFDDAITTLSDAYKYTKEHKTPVLTAEVLYTAGWIYYVKGMYDESLTHFVEARNIFREQSDYSGEGKSLMGNGLVIQALDRHDEAKLIFNQVLKIYDQHQVDEKKAAVFINLSISYIEQRRFDEAVRVLEESRIYAENYNLTGILHHYHNKSGEVAYQTNDFDNALKHHKAVLEDSGSAEANAWEKSYAYAGLAQAYLAQGNLQLAESNAVLAMDYARGSQSIWDLERNSAILSSVYAARGDSQKAYESLMENQKYRDSLYNIKTTQQVNVMHLEEKELENQQLTAQMERKETELKSKRIQIIALGVFVLLLVLILFLTWKNYRQKGHFAEELRQKNRVIETNQATLLKRNNALLRLDEHKNKLFTIISHDLRSPISSIQQALVLAEEGLVGPEDFAKLTKDLKKQTDATLVMIDNLLQWSHAQLEGVLVNRSAINLVETVSNILSTYRAGAAFKDIKLEHHKKKGLSLILVDAGHLSVILHNLISNALKFTPEGKLIQLDYEQQPDYLTLKIIDEGTGMSAEKLQEIKSNQEQILSKVGTALETGTGLGLMVVKQFLELNEATFEIESIPGKGSTFFVSFKIAPPDTDL
tara:strand:- start:14429 stop:16309 length:1881 start_codon:yes stop_codon:yes gene_type:complete